VRITGIEQINPTTVEVLFANNHRMTLDFYGPNIFRWFDDPAGGILRAPEAMPPARILVDNPRRNPGPLTLKDTPEEISVATSQMKVEINKATSQLRISDPASGRLIVQTLAAPVMDKGYCTLNLRENPDEYFYGGGIQNGRFSHRGEAIQIVNTNNWVDGGVASPTPFYWSTAGYGFMWYTFKPGKYDFGKAKPGEVLLSHNAGYLDVFFMVGKGPVALLNDFYQLTGHPVLLPKFGFYEGHLNAYNRDYWKETTATDPKGILFEDGKYYVESQKDNGGIKESLNGEKNNYQFSARAVVDRYAAHDMPLGWILPNDGYGAGYGQTNSLDGNIENLKEFGDYARKHGVQIGLWTQSNLHPIAGVEPLLQRDIVKEVRDAGVRVLKTDVAWVGAGYSFGLNGISDVAGIMPYYGHDARPFIISLDGWAGTQRYASEWTGDQTGGKWEYIRFHIPTYIGSGLSGQPNITSDMDGIFGGKYVPVNVRDFQWKAFTLIQLNMDGWGLTPKYPHILGEPAASINRSYLKLKSELLPYTYSVAHGAVDGKPVIRAMFLDYPNDYTHGTATRYQYMFGPYFLVAPVYQDTRADREGNDVRNGIYLPEGNWIDYFTGETYAGGRILNNFAAPLWKLPLFVKAGAIIPRTKANNHVGDIDRSLRIYEVYPAGKSSFTQYDDDGTTEAYLHGAYATTLITSETEKGKAVITVAPTQGDFDGFVPEKATEFRVNLTARPKKVEAFIGKQKVKLHEAASLEAFEQGSDVYFYDAAPQLNRFATKGSPFASVSITKNPELLVKLAKADTKATAVRLEVGGYVFAPANKLLRKTGALEAPVGAITPAHTEAYRLTPTWKPVANADYYEIMFDGQLYSTILDDSLLFEDLKPVTTYSFKLRAVNRDGHSAWTELQARTLSNPLEFAIHGATAEASCPSQGRRMGVEQLFNFDETNIWHSKYYQKAVPFTISIDLHSTNQLDKMEYLPRNDGSNGRWLKGSVATSADNIHWSDSIPFNWTNDEQTKTLAFPTHPMARYLRVKVSESVGDYGSGRQLYIFKVPGSKTLLPGDINSDGKVDMDDFTSYMNYTGLRRGDADFNGYVSIGDVNHNGLIDAYDISVVATQVHGGAEARPWWPKVSGSLKFIPSKTSYKAGDEVDLLVRGDSLRMVNALSFALPYDPQQLEYLGIEVKNMKDMENLTNDRLHSDGQKVLYPTFVNAGNKETLRGSEDLFFIRFRAKKAGKFNLKVSDGLLVDKSLRVVNL
jgi:hypothetical protein